jgi:pimeloyl-ACP methyl ester carboxylesterase
MAAGTSKRPDARLATEVDLELASGRLRAELRGGGDAPLLICVPGITANLRSMDAIAARLASPRRRVAALDLRGRGRSEITPAGTYGWDAHAADVLEAATALRAERFDLLGHSMGAFVAMEAAAVAPERLRRVVLVDALGYPEEGSLVPISRSMDRLGRAYPSVDAYLERARGTGLIEPWTTLWTDYYTYELAEVGGGVRPRTSTEAAAEDAAYGRAHDPAALWPALTMPVLLVRAAREMYPGTGFIVRAADRDRFLEGKRDATAVEVDANHYTVIEHATTLAAIAGFLA